MDQIRAQLAAVADLLKQDILDAQQRVGTDKRRTLPIDPARDGREIAKRSIQVFRESLSG